MKQKKIIFILIAAFFITSLLGCSKTTTTQNSQSQNKTIKVGLITDLSGINDHDFNESSYAGLKALKAANPDVTISYLESKAFSDYSTNIETFVNQGYDLIITTGVTFIDTLKEAAKDYPNQNFVITGVDIGEPLPNVACLTFANEESAYLCGIAAAMTSKTNTIGVIQGMALPNINLFGIGYIEGAKSINKDIQVLQYNANSFADLAGGNVAATNMIKNNADVIFHAAGLTGIGAINACADNKTFAIGSNSDQSDIAKDYVLLSSMQNVDMAIKSFVEDTMNNGFKNGPYLGNIKNGIVDVAYNDKIMSNDIKEKIEIAKKDIVNGKIKISQTANECPDFTLAQ